MLLIFYNIFFSRFIATVQRPPPRLTQQVDREKQDDKKDGDTVVNFKNVTLNADSDSEDEFVNIVVPLFENADSEITKSAMKEMLSRSTELRQRAEKKMKGKHGMFLIRIFENSALATETKFKLIISRSRKK